MMVPVEQTPPLAPEQLTVDEQMEQLRVAVGRLMKSICTAARIRGLPPVEAAQVLDLISAIFETKEPADG